MSKEISIDMVQKYSDHIQSKKENQIIKNAIMKNGILASIENKEAVIAMNPVFSHEIKTGKVSNQKQSGRCWMFAALNTFRHKISEKLNIKQFDLSQNYMNFWDKFEKSNYFLENIIKTSQEPLDGRLVSFLLATPQQDGGQWDMIVSLVEKYGVVPKQAMPETFQSEKSMRLNALLNERLREDALKLRELVNGKASPGELDKTKDHMLSEIYRILAYALGEPPKTFDFEYRDEDKTFHRDQNISPKEFYEKYIGVNLNDYVSVINAPTKDKPFGKTYTVQYLGNVVGGKEIQYLNVDMETLKSLAVEQIKDNESVWFGCDVGQYSSQVHGIMDTNLYDYEKAFGFISDMSKSDRLNYMGSALTHAMVLTGVNLIDDKPNRWKVENSWGEKWGNKGYFVMSDDWMDEYTYQVVIHKKYLSEELQKALKQDPISLKPWDPMGSLATWR
ncbi:aminopeptidase [Terrilactibacillus sp. BCM23-1]|uniref:Aminopeptidase n=1 Tax=Terrilactibacillus tamarindi TaxID=2599694 RepID=A0A6N8CPR6_9BACI|nr:C1 family peptidase [Terrilactibacillus tamarindi]MTT31147.1 aminopeptidase [Terrilactibacillus tamarindi]